MGRPFRQKRLLAAFLLVAVIAGAVIHHLRWHQPAIGQQLTLPDGTELTLHAVVFGRQQRVTVGSPTARLLSLFPARWVSLRKWTRALQTGVETGQASFGEPHLGLWFVRSAPSHASAVPDPGFLSWRIVAPDGAEHGGMLSQTVGASSGPGLFPAFISSYPHRPAQFTVEFWLQVPPKPGQTDTVQVGRFLIRNPSRSVGAAGEIFGPKNHPQALNGIRVGPRAREKSL